VNPGAHQQDPSGYISLLPAPCAVVDKPAQAPDTDSTKQRRHKLDGNHAEREAEEVVGLGLRQKEAQTQQCERKSGVCLKDLYYIDDTYVPPLVFVQPKNYLSDQASKEDRHEPQQKLPSLILWDPAIVTGKISQVERYTGNQPINYESSR